MPRIYARSLSICYLIKVMPLYTYHDMQCFDYRAAHHFRLFRFLCFMHGETFGN